MDIQANEARGEFLADVNGVKVVVAAEMQHLAMLSSSLGCQSWDDMVKRISGFELAAMYGVLEICVVRGDIKAARKAMTPAGAFELGGAMTLALASCFPDEGTGKNARGAGASSSKASPGAAG